MDRVEGLPDSPGDGLGDVSEPGAPSRREGVFGERPWYPERLSRLAEGVAGGRPLDPDSKPLMPGPIDT